MRWIISGLLVLIGIIGILYLSWLPQPKLGLVWFVPRWLAEWTDTDANSNLRTGIPFVILGIIVGSFISGPGYLWYRWLAGWLGLVAVVFVAESGQLLLPKRSFDWLDIAWGAAGALAGMSIALIVNQLKGLLSAPEAPDQ